MYVRLCVGAREALIQYTVQLLSTLTLLSHFLPSGELSKTGLQPITGIPRRARRQGLRIICLLRMTHTDQMEDGHLTLNQPQESKDQN